MLAAARSRRFGIARVLLCLAALPPALPAASPCPAAEAPPATRPAADGWQVFQAREGFQLELPPGKVQRQLHGGVTAMYALEVRKDLAYLASSTTLPVQDPTPEKMDAIQKGIATRGKILDSKDLPARDGMLVRQIVIRDVKENLISVDRILLGRGRLYQLLVLSTGDLSDEADTKRFLDSFKLLPREAPILPKPAPPAVDRPALPRPPRPGPASRPEVKPPAPAAPEGDALTAAIAALKSGDERERRTTLKKLQGMSVDEKRRPEVAKAIVPLLADSEHFIRCDALKALASWWTPETLADVVKAAKDDHFSVRWAAYDTLAQIPDERSGQALADGLITDQGKARQALKTLGSVAEPAVLKLLANEDRKVVTAACDALGDIGTAKSAAALKLLTNHKDFFIRTAAGRALAKVKDRT